MNGEERRKKILNILSSAKSPVAGVKLAKDLDVSRQVIVQDHPPCQTVTLSQRVA